MKSSDSNHPDISAETLADAQLVADCVATGRPIPPEVARRIQDDARQITERLRRQYGILDIGVPAIRELRGEWRR